MTYDFNNEATENNTATHEFYPSSTLKSVNTDALLNSLTITAPEGKKFRGWNTQADGRGTRYSAGDLLSLRAEKTLYAQWCPYNEDEKVYTISTEDDFWAFFSYSGTQSYDRAAHDSVKLLADISLTDWIAPKIFNGTFDGNSKSLTYTLASSSSCALFQELSGNSCTVKNLTLTGLTLSTSSSQVAALALKATDYATISGVTLEKSTITSLSSTACVGGLIAEANNIKTSSNTIKGENDTSSGTAVTTPVKIKVTSGSYIGGIAGYNDTNGKINGGSFVGRATNSSTSSYAEAYVTESRATTKAQSARQAQSPLRELFQGRE